MLNAITIDVEDYFHTEAMTAAVSRDQWSSMPSRVEEMTERVLALLAEHNIRGTMFFLGWVAERFPRLVLQATKLGHEVACHSYWHRPVFRLDPAEFRDDTQRAKAAIEDAGGVAVRGYRAPSFSMTLGTEWAQEALAELGFTYDSSVNPIRHDFYSNADAPRTPYKIAAGAMVEIPIASVQLGTARLPCGGGAYLRALPLQYFRWSLRRLNNHERMPAMMYLHPWELDPEQPRLAAGFKARMRQYTGLRNMQPRLSSLLKEFSFAPVSEAFAEVLPNTTRTRAQQA